MRGRQSTSRAGRKLAVSRRCEPGRGRTSRTGRPICA